MQQGGAGMQLAQTHAAAHLFHGVKRVVLEPEQVERGAADGDRAVRVLPARHLALAAQRVRKPAWEQTP